MRSTCAPIGPRVAALYTPVQSTPKTAESRRPTANGVIERGCDGSAGASRAMHGRGIKEGTRKSQIGVASPGDGPRQHAHRWAARAPAAGADEAGGKAVQSNITVSDGISMAHRGCAIDGTRESSLHHRNGVAAEGSPGSGDWRLRQTCRLREAMASRPARFVSAGQSSPARRDGTLCRYSSVGAVASAHV